MLVCCWLFSWWFYCPFKVLESSFKFDRALSRELWTNLPCIVIAICSEIFSRVDITFTFLFCLLDEILMRIVMWTWKKCLDIVVFSVRFSHLKM